MATGWQNILFGGKRVGDANSFHKYGSAWKWKGWHTGEDFGTSQGTPVNAPLSGKVIGQTTGGPYGLSVLVQLDSGEYMRFAHLSKVSVSNGQRLKAGTYIGAVGHTGNASGSHLHLEVMTRRGDGFVDPVAFLNGKKTSGNVEAPSGGSSNAPASSTNTTTINVSDGGWTKMAGSTGFNKKDFYAALEQKYGNIDVLLKLDKEAQAELGGKSIKWAIDQMVKQKVTNPDLARSILLQTGWFKKYGEETSLRLVAEKNRPDLFATSVSEKRSGIEAILNRYGVKLSDGAINTLARNAYVYNWQDEATIIDQMQKQEGDALVFEGGEIAAGVDALETFADDYGVSLTDADLRQFRRDILDGEGGQKMKDAIQERAAQKYAVFADQIRKGQSTKALASAYFSSAADLLEVDAESISWDDPLFAGGKAFTAVDPKTGQPVTKGLWDFEKEVRKDSRWLNTKNARDSMVETSANILKTMGFM